MSWGMVAVGGATLVAGAMSSRASRDAARGQGAAASEAARLNLEAQRESIAAQNAALEKSLAEQRRQFDTVRLDSQPWRQTGVSALEQLRGLMDVDPSPTAESVMAEPGYQFGLTQGRNAMESSAAARGGLYSGNALRELTQFGGDYATGRFNDAFNRQRTSFGDRWNRLSGLAGTGQVATQQVGAAGQNMANNVSNMYGSNADRQGSLLMGTANAIGNTGMSNANAQGAARMNQANIWGNALGQLGGLYGSSIWGRSNSGGRSNRDLGMLEPGGW